MRAYNRILRLLVAATVCSCGGDSTVGPPSQPSKPPSLSALQGTTISLTSVNGKTLPALYDEPAGSGLWADSATITFQSDSVLALRAYYGGSNAPNTSRSAGPSQFMVSKSKYSVSNGVVLLAYPQGGVPDTLIPVIGGFDAHLSPHDSLQPTAARGVWRFATAWKGQPLFPIPTLSSYLMMPPGGDLATLARSLPFVYGTIMITGSAFTSETNFPGGDFQYIPGVQAPLRVAYVSDTLLRVDNVPVTWFLPGARNPITVVNPAPGGGPASITIVGTNPMPDMTSIAPTGGTVMEQGVRITVTGANFTTATAVLLNGVPIQTMFTSSSQIVGFPGDSDLAQAGTVQVSVRTPAPGGGTSNALPFTITGVASQLISNTVAAVTLSARFMVADPIRPLVYVGTDDYEVKYPNSVVAIDIGSGAVAWTVPIGANANALAVSSGGEFLYVGSMQRADVVRINLGTHATDLTIPLGGDSVGLFRARHIAVAPGAPHTIAVDPARIATPETPPHGVMIFDDSIERPLSLSGPSRATVIAFGSTADTLYGFDGGQNVFVMDVSPSGVTSQIERNVSVVAGPHQMISTGGRLFFSDGTVVDPETSSPPEALANYQSGYVLGEYPLAFSSDGRRIYAVYNKHLIAWDTQTLAQIGSIAIPLPESATAYVVRWGADGIAFLQSGQVHFVRASMVY